MGIDGLKTKLTKMMCKKIYPKQLRGLRVGVDISKWMHDAARNNFSREICNWKEKEPRPKGHLQPCIDMLTDLVTKTKVIPTLVFDGDRLDMKMKRKTQSQRENEIDRAKAMDIKGKRDDALEIYKKNVKLTPEDGHNLIQMVKALPELDPVKCLVAPYEADSQLAYLAMNGHVDAVITGDTDLVAYGCERVIFDWNGKIGDEYLYSNLYQNKGDFKGFSKEQLLQTCLFSTNDYVKSLKGMNLETAVKLMKEHGTYEMVFQHLKSEFQSTKEVANLKRYMNKYKKVLKLYKYSTVYHPVMKVHIGLNELPFDQAQGDLTFLGRVYDPCTARRLAESLIHPGTKKPYQRPENKPIPLWKQMQAFRVRTLMFRSPWPLLFRLSYVYPYKKKREIRAGGVPD